MTDQTSNRLQSIRTVLEGAVLAMLIWVGSSLLGLKTDMAVIQSQLSDMKSQISDVPVIKTGYVELKLRIEQLEKDRDEFRKVKNLGER